MKVVLFPGDTLQVCFDTADDEGLRVDYTHDSIAVHRGGTCGGDRLIHQEQFGNELPASAVELHS